MRNLLQQLREAMEVRTGHGTGTHDVEFVRVHQGRLYARNGRLWASVPCPGEEFVAHADTLFRVLDRLPDAEVAGVTPRRLTVRHAKGRAYIKAMPPEQWSMVHWRAAAPMSPFNGTAFLASLRRLRPFVSDNEFYKWSIGVQCVDDLMMATNNVVIAVLRCTPLGWNGLLPTWLLDFVLAQDRPPDRFGSDGALSFGWDTGLEVTALVPVESFPEPAIVMARDPCPETAWPVPQAWKEAVQRIAGMVDETTGLEVRADAIVAKASDVLDLEEQVASPVAEPRRFGAQSLGKVAEVALQLEVDSKVAKWRGADGLFGVIAGRA